jgi:DNA polymerase-3 subunit beta
LLLVVERLLSIGEFAERSGLSRSALRFYDQNELLRPQLIDPDSGYRYYGVGQLEQALLVRRLRLAELPVGALREYLAAAPERRREILESHVASFRRRASAIEATIEVLRGELDRGEAGAGLRCCAMVPAVFAHALNQVRFAVADPAVRPELGAVWVETKEGSLRLVATDSYRLAIRDLVPDEVGSVAIRGVIDAGQVETLMAALSAAASFELCQSEAGWVTAVTDGLLLTVGGTGDTFPDYEEILSGLPAGHQIAVTADDVRRALAGLPLDGKALLLGFSADGLGLEAAGRSQTVTGSWPGPDLRICLDPRFFADAVAATVGPDLVIEASGPLEPVTLRSADTGTFSVLTMPIHPPDLA